MSFRLSEDEPVDRGVRRMAFELIDKALNTIGNQRLTADERIHKTRQSCKRLRGTMRLVRPIFREYARDNTIVRDAAARLSAARDAHVLIETFDALIATGGSNQLLLAQEVIRAELTARSTSAEGEDKEQLLADCAATLAGVKDGISDWHLSGSGFSALQPGLALNYAEARKGLDTAWRKREDEAFHTARKHVKYYWHHLTILRDAAPDLLGQHRQMAGALAELLGDHHNLAVLKETATAERAAFGGKDVARALADACMARQSELADSIFALGLQLLAEDANALSGRFKQHWHAWRKRQTDERVLL
jgi:hypothetical protein